MLNYTLIYGDCIKEMQRLADDGIKVDMVLTDIPYGTTSCKWDNIIPFDKMWDCINKLSYDDTPCLLFNTEPFGSYLRLSNITDYRYDWVWYKNTTSGFQLAKKQPLRNYELISVFYKKQPVYNPIKEPRDMDKKNKKRLNYEFNSDYGSEIYGTKKHDNKRKIDKLSYPKSVKRFKSVPNSKKIHPTQKPVDLLKYLIKTYSNEDNTVLDFTMGSGSTGVACANTNRSFIGIENDKKYFEIARKRLKETI